MAFEVYSVRSKPAKRYIHLNVVSTIRTEAVFGPGQRAVADLTVFYVYPQRVHPAIDRKSTSDNRIKFQVI